MKKINYSDILSFGPCKDPSPFFPKDFNWSVLEHVDNHLAEIEDLIWVCVRKETVGEELLCEYVIDLISRELPNAIELQKSLEKFKKEKSESSAIAVLEAKEKEIYGVCGWHFAVIFIFALVKPDVFINEKFLENPPPAFDALIEARPKMRQEMEIFKQFIIKNQDRLP